MKSQVEYTRPRLEIDGPEYNIRGPSARVVAEENIDPLEYYLTGKKIKNDDINFRSQNIPLPNRDADFKFQGSNYNIDRPFREPTEAEIENYLTGKKIGESNINLGKTSIKFNEPNYDLGRVNVDGPEVNVRRSGINVNVDEPEWKRSNISLNGPIIPANDPTVEMSVNEPYFCDGDDVETDINQIEVNLAKPDPGVVLPSVQVPQPVVNVQTPVVEPPKINYNLIKNVHIPSASRIKYDNNLGLLKGPRRLNKKIYYDKRITTDRSKFHACVDINDDYY